MFLCPASSVWTTLNFWTSLSVIFIIPFLSGSSMISTGPLPAEGDSPTRTEVAFESMSLTLNAKKLPGPHAETISPGVLKYLTVPVNALFETDTSSCRSLTAVPNTSTSPSSASTVRSVKKNRQYPLWLLRLHIQTTASFP